MCNCMTQSKRMIEKEINEIKFFIHLSLFIVPYNTHAAIRQYFHKPIFRVSMARTDKPLKMQLKE